MDEGGCQSSIVSHSAALNNDDAPQLNEELKISVLYGLFREGLDIWVDDGTKSIAAGCKRKLIDAV